jgi:hypothetical protein
VGDTRVCDEARRSQGGFFDRRVRILLEQAQEPARGDPLVPARILARDEHSQVERIDEAQLREILGRGQRREHSPALQCPFGYVAHDEAADPAALLDTAVTVGSDGIVRKIAVSWASKGSYEVRVAVRTGLSDVLNVLLDGTRDRIGQYGLGRRLDGWDSWILSLLGSRFDADSCTLANTCGAGLKGNRADRRQEPRAGRAKHRDACETGNEPNRYELFPLHVRLAGLECFVDSRDRRRGDVLRLEGAAHRLTFDRRR